MSHYDFCELQKENMIFNLFYVEKFLSYENGYHILNVYVCIILLIMPQPLLY